MKCLNMKLSVFAALVIGSLATDHLTYNMGGGDKGGGKKVKEDKYEGQAAASNKDKPYNQMSSDYSTGQASAGQGDKSAPGNSYGQPPASNPDVSGQGNSYGQMPASPQGSVEANAPSTGKVHDIIVGGSNGLVYTPDTINAAVGDMVNFIFMMTNHTLTQSTFDKPCVKMPNGADSGFLPNPNNTIVPAPSFKFEVKNTAATWFYCKQRTGNHCGKGMVFSINPTAEKSHAIFKQMAMQQNGTATASGTASSTASSTATESTTVTELTLTTATAAATTDVQLAVSTTSADSPAATGGANLAQGSGPGANGGTCSCTCLCGVGAFPAGAGVGNWGGYGGAMPAPWAAPQESSPPAAAAAAAPGVAYR